MPQLAAGGCVWLREKEGIGTRDPGEGGTSEVQGGSEGKEGQCPPALSWGMPAKKPCVTWHAAAVY